jgi:hypothetical protein
VNSLSLLSLPVLYAGDLGLGLIEGLFASH